MSVLGRIADLSRAVTLDVKSPGDLLYILGETRDGAHATFAVVPARNLMPKPANLGFEEAAAFGLTFQTAWHMLIARARLQPGETVVIHAAGSGVSTAGIVDGPAAPTGGRAVCFQSP